MMNCPFCGSRNLKAFAKLAGKYLERYYRAQVRCLKCGAAGPVVRMNTTVLTEAEQDMLFKEAFEKFNNRF